MRSFVTVLSGIALGLSSPGCSWVYDPDQLENRVDARDLPIDGGFELRVVAMTELVEGLGCSVTECPASCTAAGCPFGDIAGVVVVEVPVAAAIASATGRIESVGVDAVVDPIGVSTDSRQLAYAVRIPVSDRLGPQGYSLALTFRLADQRATTVAVDVVGLAELLMNNNTTAGFAPRYSSITVPPGATPLLTGNVRLRATSDVLISGTLSVSATSSAPGAGGCLGAPTDATRQADCGDGGGHSVAESPGAIAGGGSFGTVGGAGPGVAGDLTGNPELVPLGVDGNTGNGGGAFGPTAGGHGGGAIEVTTRGQLQFSGSGSIIANGGAPSTPGPSGGGSGGAILVRAGSRLRWTGEPAAVMIADGGGSGAAQGGQGRIRIGTVTVLAVDPIARPLPYLSPAVVAPPLVIAPSTTIVLRAAPSMLVALQLDGDDAGSCTTDAGGTCAISVTAAPGVHELCVPASASLGSCDLPEACDCYQAVALP